MSTPEEFNQNMQRRGDTVTRRATAIQRMMAGAILQAVVLATPVGNAAIWLEPKKARVGYVGGRARANWLVGIGSAPAVPVDTTDASGGATISAGVAAMDAVAPEQAIHITNNLPYIMPLNEGHSHQAPAGFVEIAIQQGIAAVQGQPVTEDK